MSRDDRVGSLGLPSAWHGSTLAGAMDMQEKNIVLIGMPGVGKSTVGVLLAKALGRYFVDTDVYMQAIQGRPLQEMIDRNGLQWFLEAEEDYVLCLDETNAVIATGGSVVYSETAMQHLGSRGIVVHLDLPVGQIEDRLQNLRTRGVVMEAGQTIHSLYEQREPLYRKYAQVTIDCTGKNHDQTVTEVVTRLRS